MIDPERIKFLNAQLDNAAAQLGEHFDAVQILAVYAEGSATVMMSSGVGNIFARNGMLHEYMAQAQIHRTVAVMNQLNTPPPTDIF